MVLGVWLCVHYATVLFKRPSRTTSLYQIKLVICMPNLNAIFTLVHMEAYVLYFIELQTSLAVKYIAGRNDPFILKWWWNDLSGEEKGCLSTIKLE